MESSLYFRDWNSFYYEEVKTMNENTAKVVGDVVFAGVMGGFMFLIYKMFKRVY